MIRGLLGLFLIGLPLMASAAPVPSVVVKKIVSAPLEGPAHHGLVVYTDGIDLATLTAYEVNIKLDTPYDTWKMYNPSLKPFDTTKIILPYRNGIYAMSGDQKYCLRVRGLFGDSVSPWVNTCGITLVVPPSSDLDSDGDGLSDAEEYVLGTDPNNADSDGDGVSDGIEASQGHGANDTGFPQLVIRTRDIKFGAGDPFGTAATQHRVIEIANIGSANAVIQDISVVDDSGTGSADGFKLDSYPPIISNLPPYNVMRLPVSFIPTKRGEAKAKVIVTIVGPTPVEKVSLSGTGVHIPNCSITPEVKTLPDGQTVLEAIELSNMPTSSDPSGLAPDAALTFTLISQIPGVAPGVNGLAIPAGKKLRIPVISAGTSTSADGAFDFHSIYCGNHTIQMNGEVK